MMKARTFLVTAGVLMLWLITDSSAQMSFTPKNGFVPDEATAVAVAEVILTPIYGRETVQSERPFHAKLESKAWVVSGSIPKGLEGGVAIIKIAKSDGRVLLVTHSK